MGHFYGLQINNKNIITGQYHGASAKLYMPLSLAFGKTIHSFQGASVGKTAPGRPDNDFKRIVGDPGTRQFESINPSLFYTLLSRETTFGEERKTATSTIFKRVKHEYRKGKRHHKVQK